MKQKIYMPNDARLRLVNIFDKEIIEADNQKDEKLRLALCRIKGEMLQC